MTTFLRMPQLSKYAAALTLAALASLGTAQASTVLVDRGLPTANLNNIAGANRSNVAWVDTYTSSNDYIVMGDTFTNSGAEAWHIDSIRVWIVGSASTASLWGGVAGGSMGVASAAGTISAAAVTYQGGATYQGSSGAMISMFQVDFAVDITLAGGETYEFFLDGTGNGNFVVPFMHASNAALSGSPQDGADGLVIGGRILNGAFSSAPGDSYTWASTDGGWDKVSDFNVQVSGNVIPEPASLALVGAALLGLAATRRRA